MDISSMPMDINGTLKLEPKIFFNDKNIDLDEIPEQIDISINLPEKKVPDATKQAPKSNSVTLF